jgi:hypothetical protein
MSGMSRQVKTPEECERMGILVKKIHRTTGSRFLQENRSAISIAKSDRDCHRATAITIAVKNHSGKISNRFSSRNRIPIFK